MALLIFYDCHKPNAAGLAFGVGGIIHHPYGNGIVAALRDVSLLSSV